MSVTRRQRRAKMKQTRRHKAKHNVKKNIYKKIKGGENSSSERRIAKSNLLSRKFTLRRKPLSKPSSLSKSVNSTRSNEESLSDYSLGSINSEDFNPRHGEVAYVADVADADVVADVAEKKNILDEESLKQTIDVGSSTHRILKKLFSTFCHSIELKDPYTKYVNICESLKSKKLISEESFEEKIKGLDYVNTLFKTFKTDAIDHNKFKEFNKSDFKQLTILNDWVALFETSLGFQNEYEKIVPTYDSILANCEKFKDGMDRKPVDVKKECKPNWDSYKNPLNDYDKKIKNLNFFQRRKITKYILKTCKANPLDRPLTVKKAVEKMDKELNTHFII